MFLDLTALNSAIADTEFAGQIHHIPTVDSTQNLAIAAARSGARHGVWIADEQTAGRGRGAHTWHSPTGENGEAAGLYMSALTAPPIPMQGTLGLSFRTALAVQAAIAETTGLAIPIGIDIRWPNDLVVPEKDRPQKNLPQPTGSPQAPSRKVGGILIEQAAHPVPRTGPAMLKYTVVGIGINLNQLAFPPELDSIATSLRRELPGHPAIGREPLVAAILRNLAAELDALAAAQTPPDPSSLEARSSWLRGKRVRVEPRPGDPATQPGYTGVTAGLNPQGFLLVQGDDGQLHTVLSGGLREP